MAKKRNLIIFLVVLILGGLFYWLMPRQKRYVWREYYDEKIDQPYGTKFLFELMKSLFPEKSFAIIQNGVYKDLPEETMTPSNYIFVGQAMLFDSLDTEKLIKFVEGGNTAFISSKTVPNNLMDKVFFNECNDYAWLPYDQRTVEDSIELGLFYEGNFLSAENYQFVRRNVPFKYSWQYVNDTLICDLPGQQLETLGYIQFNQDTFINYFSIQYGKGQFLLHTNPLVFTNFFMVEGSKLIYPELVFSELNSGDIYWDSYSHISEQMGRRMNNQPSLRTLSNQSPLSYILSEPALSWAWYLLIASGILFLAFRSKRRQKVIPVTDPNINTSHEFLSTIGRLYFLQNNHRQLALLKISLLKNYIRDRYNISLKKEYPEPALIQISNKSSVAKDFIEKLFVLCQNIENSSFVSENTLIDFHQIVDEFYRNSK